MPTLVYKFHDGASQTVDAAVGDSVMQAAVHNDVPGILGRCGGFTTCGTCHVYIDDAWLSLLPPVGMDEDALLSDCASERLENSRLSCQVILTEALDGMIVRVPEQQEFT